MKRLLISVLLLMFATIIFSQADEKDEKVNEQQDIVMSTQKVNF